MVHHERLLSQIAGSTASYDRYANAYNEVCTLWHELASSESMVERFGAGAIRFNKPLAWRQTARPLSEYRVMGIDGSQVYPNRHEGLPAFLINIGHALLSYGSPSRAQLDSFPVFFTGVDGDGHQGTESYISCLRTEYEYAHAKDYVGDLIMFDGSLYMWQLLQMPHAVAELFVHRYLRQLNILHEQAVPWCGFISMPHSHDIVGILNEAATHGARKGLKENFMQVPDAVVMGQSLNPGEFTQLFSPSMVPWGKVIPAHLWPCFMYLHTGTEIARIEIPAWVAQDQSLLERTMHIVYDQCCKGRGYPISLCEAHEQAVVSEKDRQFFYQVLRAQLKGSGTLPPTSQKLLRKRRAPI